MQQELIVKHYIDYNRSIIDHVFDAAVLIQDQVERMTTAWIEKHLSMITESQNTLQRLTFLISKGSKDYRNTVYDQFAKLEGLFVKSVNLHAVDLKKDQNEDIKKQAS